MHQAMPGKTCHVQYLPGRRVGIWRNDTFPEKLQVSEHATNRNNRQWSDWVVNNVSQFNKASPQLDRRIWCVVTFTLRPGTNDTASGEFTRPSLVR